MEIGATVVLYNPKEKEITNINKYASKLEYLIIIDNSPVSHEKVVEKNVNYSDTEVTYKHYPENIGLCKALNKGIHILNKKGCTWSLVLDSDSEFQTDILDIYKKFLLNDKELKKMNKVAILSPQHNHDRKKVNIYDGFKEKKWAMTSGWLINTKIFMNHGGFFEELFVDGLDIDYCYRIREAGYLIIECGQAILQHYPGETKQFKILNIPLFVYGQDSPKRYKMQARALIWVILRYKTVNEVIIYLYKWVKILFLFKDKKNYIEEMYLGTLDGIALFNKRKKMKKEKI